VLRRIVPVGLICLFLIGAIGCRDKAAPKPSLPVITPTQPAQPPRERYIEVSSFDLIHKLIDPQLTELQRQDLWEQHQGKRVRWINEVEGVEQRGEDIVVVFVSPKGFSIEDYEFEHFQIEATFDRGQRPKLLELKEGDLVIYSGILDSFEKAGSIIRIKESSIVSPNILKPLWRIGGVGLGIGSSRIIVREGIIYLAEWFGKLGGGSYFFRNSGLWAVDAKTGKLLWKDKAEDTVAAIDDRYIYVWNVTVKETYIEIAFSDLEIKVLDKFSGKTVYTQPIKGWYRSREAREETIQKLREKTMAMIGPEALFFIDKPETGELRQEWGGLVYSVMGPEGVNECYLGFRAVDPRKGSVVWTLTKNVGIFDFAIDNGVLYITNNWGYPKGYGLYAFKLLDP